MSDTILDASVKISIDSNSIDKSIKDASKKLEAGLQKADAKLSKQLTKQIDRDLGRIGRSFERGADKLSKVLEKGLKFGLGAGTAAIYAFLKSGTPEALKFSNSLDKVKVAWARVGGILATKIKFGGATGQEWIDRLVNKLENLDLSQIEKAVDYFKLMAGLAIGFKAISIGFKAAELGSTIASAITSAIAKAGIGSTIGNTAANVASNLGGGILAGTGAGVASTATIAKVFGKDFSKAISDAKPAKMIASNGTPFSYFDKMKAQAISVKSEVFGGKAFEAGKSFGKFQGMTKTAGLIAGDVLSRTSNMLGIAGGVIETFKSAGMVDKGNFKGAFQNQFSGSIGPLGALTGAQKYSEKYSERFGATGKYAGGFYGQIIGGLGGSNSNFIEQLTDRAINYLFPRNNGNSINWGNVIEQTRRDKRNDIENSFLQNSSNIVKPYSNKLESFDKFKMGIVGGESSSNLSRGFGYSLKNMRANLEQQLASIENELNNDIELELRDTLKAQIDKTKALLQNVLERENVIVEQYIKEQDKVKSVQKSLEAFDKNVADAQMNYDMYAQKSMEETPKALRGSISMGGDISSLPSIISQSLQEAKNSEAEKQLELMQKGIDLEEAYGKMMEDIWNNDQARAKYLEEERENFKQSQKTREQLLEEAKKSSSYEQQMTRLLGGGSSATVTNMY